MGQAPTTGDKAAVVQNTLDAKDQEIDTYRADAKN